jgi:hypothetical protein
LLVGFLRSGAYVDGLLFIIFSFWILYHLDNKNRSEDQLAIQTCLILITHLHAQPIILFTSSQSLSEGLSWAPLLKQLAKRKLFTLRVFDEAHTIPLHGCCFDASLLKCARVCHPYLRVLTMSASFWLEEQAKFSSIMLVKPTHIFWGPMACRGILFRVSVLGILQALCLMKWLYT